MKYIIYLFILFIIVTIQLSASDWQRVDGPYDEALIHQLFEFNNNLYAQSSSDFVNYKFVEGKWEFLDLNLPSKNRF